ncbi:hypothetical protein ABI_22140 [Asticcacaulis biprosthecium C19]|uniref:Putative DNA-binding domain-containing protein n=1 Tax=Asticcacaulis biprosthecium C19 TaxID=715226 RepID=F4QN95_9CAUL|nr:putative DNA-binding domain-containing protein [Asticcacaulis biprosthecium]EGF90803.1 hypothetical protein ABI_22140 [Asticcacaulis biprosthecium C19]
MTELSNRQAEMIAFLCDPTAVAPTRGHAVYHNAYRGRLKGVLAETYAKLKLWLGDEGFDAVATAFVDGFPSRSWTLNVFGEEFAAYLAEFYSQDPEVAELAWLEWALHTSFSGRDSANVTAADLTDIDWDRAALVFVPTLALRPVTSNAAAIWQALAGTTQPPAAARLDSTAHLCVWRHGLEPKFKTISSDEAAAIDALRGGLSFPDLCARLAATQGDSAAGIAGGWLAAWIGDGQLARIEPCTAGVGGRADLS